MPFDYSKVESLYPGAGGLINEPMLIWKLPSGKEHLMSEVCNNGQYFAEEKIDGCLYTYVKGREGQNYLFGRTVSKITGISTEKGENVPHIISALNCLPNITVLVGEIYYDGCTAKDVTKIMGCLSGEATRRQNDPSGKGLIKYYIHDIIYYDGINLSKTGAWDRYRILQAVYHKYNLDQYSFLRLAEAVENGIEDEVSRILASGGEGMVLKKRDGIYDFGKRPAHLTIKFKQMDDTDLICTRTIPASRNYTGKEIETWPYWEKPTDNSYVSQMSLECMYGEEGWEPVTKPYAFGWHTAIGIGAYDDNGNLIELGTVSSGLTDEDKAAMGADPDSFIGKVVSLHCMLLDKKEKTLRHPVFKSWRDDKNPYDCKINEVFK